MVDSLISMEGTGYVSESIKQIDILWITAGLGCDGETIAMTAATQPSIEDILLGAIPWIPKVRLHNPVLSYEVGDDFMNFLYLAEEGKLDPFILVKDQSLTNGTKKKAIGRRSEQTS